MTKVVLEAEVEEWINEFNFKFGRTRASMWIPSRGKIARKLKLKDGQKVKVTIEKI